jgi:hypothetical protein
MNAMAAVAAMKGMLELQLVCGALREAEIPFFVALCEQVGLRPLLIDHHHPHPHHPHHPHDGQRRQQPSATAWLRADLEEAKAEAMALAQWLARAGMAVLGVKVDAPVREDLSLRPGQYFEWRGKLRQLHDVSALQRLCEAHGARLSRDSLRGEADTCFVTLRSRAPMAVFSERATALAAQLAHEGWPLLKQDAEICLHDSSELPDADWLAPYLLPPTAPDTPGTPGTPGTSGTPDSRAG